MTDATPRGDSRPRRRSTSRFARTLLLTLLFALGLAAPASGEAARGRRPGVRTLDSVSLSASSEGRRARPGAATPLRGDGPGGHEPGDDPNDDDGGPNWEQIAGYLLGLLGEVHVIRMHEDFYEYVEMAEIELGLPNIPKVIDPKYNIDYRQLGWKYEQLGDFIKMAKQGEADSGAEARRIYKTIYGDVPNTPLAAQQMQAQMVNATAMIYGGKLARESERIRTTINAYIDLKNKKPGLSTRIDAEISRLKAEMEALQLQATANQLQLQASQAAAITAEQTQRSAGTLASVNELSSGFRALVKHSDGGSFWRPSWDTHRNDRDPEEGE